jgi:hypothetical protein
MWWLWFKNKLVLILAEKFSLYSKVHFADQKVISQNLLSELKMEKFSLYSKVHFAYQKVFSQNLLSELKMEKFSLYSKVHFADQKVISQDNKVFVGFVRTKGTAGLVVISVEQQ